MGDVRKVIKVEDVERVLRFFKEINTTPLEDIVWTKDGVVLEVTPEQLEEYRFIGLSNRDFPSVMGWLPEDVGIQIATMVLTPKK